MNVGRTVFSQLMAFAQLTYRESLRDIEACLRSLGPTLYHSGLRSTVSRATLADDRAYTGFGRLKRIDSSGAFFVIRAKRGLQFSRPLSHPVDKVRGINVDQTIHLANRYTVERYPDALRRIKYPHSSGQPIESIQVLPGQ